MPAGIPRLQPAPAVCPWAVGHQSHHHLQHTSYQLLAAHSYVPNLGIFHLLVVAGYWSQEPHSSSGVCIVWFHGLFARYEYTG